PIEVGREVLGGYLHRRRPRGGDVHLRAEAVTAGDVRGQIAGGVAGEQDAVDHRMERLGGELGACAGGDRLGQGVGLLRGDPAELDRELGDVAGGVHVIDVDQL